MLCFLPFDKASAGHIIAYNDEMFNQLSPVSLFLPQQEHTFFQIQAASDSFSVYGDKTLNLTYQQNDAWVHFSLRSKQEINNAVLSINYPLIDDIVCYQRVNNNPWDSFSVNLNSTIADRQLPSQFFTFKLAGLHPDDSIEIYIKAKAELVLSMPLQIEAQTTYMRYQEYTNIVLSVYMGLMLCIFLYNLFVFISVRDRNYLYYVWYVLFIMVAQLGLSGFLIRYFLPNALHNTDIIIISSVISGICAIKFASKFLMLSIFSPKLNKGLIVFYVGYVFILVAYISGKHLVAFQTLDAVGLFVSLYALVFSVYVAIFKQYRPGKFFLIAWSFFIFSLVVFIMKSYGVIANTLFSNAALQWGSATEALLLSFALADRINILKKEKEASQAEALEAAKENARIIREQNMILEHQVDERTKELKVANTELNQTLSDLKETQSQLVESEKMASLGQLTAGIAHEINNPINFVTSNVKPLKRDVDMLLDMIQRIEAIALSDIQVADKQKKINSLKTEFDFDYLHEEIAFLLKGINEGSTRTAEIVKGLRIFSRVDEDDLKKADLNEGLDSTIIIINNLLNGKIVINKQYGNIPLVECYPGKLNQVFLNLISNAIYAVNTKFNGEPGGEIIIKTETNEQTVTITISDNGSGMNESTLKKLFEPFFTTKPVGEGTGLGLSISYNTIKKHFGTIDVQSALNQGTSFTLEIPIIHPNS